MNQEPIIVKYDQLQLGDVVRLLSNTGAYSTSTVKQIKDGLITFFRPYVQTADFSCTSGVICYIGIEEFTVPVDFGGEVELFRRVELK